MLLSLLINAYLKRNALRWKPVDAYCVNCCNTNIPGYLFFCDCYRNIGHFLCSVERIKRFLNLHLHCIVSSVPSKGRKYSWPPELLRSEIFLAQLQHSKAMEQHANKKLFEWNVYFVRIFIRLYMYRVSIKSLYNLKKIIKKWNDEISQWGLFYVNQYFIKFLLTHQIHF